MNIQALIVECNKRTKKLYEILDKYFEQHNKYPDLPHIPKVSNIDKNDDHYTITFVNSAYSLRMIHTLIPENVETSDIIKLIHKFYLFDNIDTHCSQNLHRGEGHCEYITNLLESLRI